MYGSHYKAEQFIGQPRQALYHVIKIVRSQTKSKNQIAYIKYYFTATNYKTCSSQITSCYKVMRKRQCT